MNLSKSKYCNGLQCKKMLWLYKNKPEEKEEVNNESVFDNGNDVHEVARKLLGEDINIPFNEDLTQMIKDTKEVMKQEKVIITEASFSYENNFCSVDILKKEGKTYEIYEVKSSTELKDVYVDDVSYQYFVLTSLGLKVEKCYVVILNNRYVRKGKLDLNQLFKKIDVTDEVVSKQEEVRQIIKDMNKYMEQKKEPQDDIGIHCFKPYKCPFFKYCTRHLPSPNVFDVNGMKKNVKLQLYKEGICSYRQLIMLEDGRVTEEEKFQIEFDYNNLDDIVYRDEDKIREFLNELTMPLYFLDFETFATPIPKIDGTRPYERIPFQHSLHYIENDKLYHKEFLAESGIDPRRTLAERLVNDIPYDVCTLAYNMGFEKGVIRELASMYPDLSNHLMNIHDNMKDLMIPFFKKWYYRKELHGLYSIKYVLPSMFPNDESLNYKNLELVHNGDEAMNIYARLGEYSKEEQEYIRERLLKYCELDTYAMVKIYEKLKQIVKS